MSSKTQFQQRLNASRTNNPFSRRTSTQDLLNTVLPIHGTVVRFTMQSLGDPFYRLLGHPLNKDYAEIKSLASALWQENEAVEAITAALDATWESYDLQGAMTVYPYNNKVFATFKDPQPMPEPPKVEEEKEEEDKKKNPFGSSAKKRTAEPVYSVEVLRSTDPALTLNVLARARSQVLLASAPLVYGIEYIGRTLYTDDPRLVELAQATGCLSDE